MAATVEVVAVPDDKSPSLSAWRSACAEIANLTFETAKNVLLIALAARRAKVAYEALHQNSHMNFSAAIAEETGLHRILINRYVQIADGLDDDIIAKIQDTAIAADLTFLISLVQAEPETRAKALEAYKTVAEPGTPAEKSKKVEAKRAARKVLASNLSSKQKRAAAKRKKKEKNRKAAPPVKHVEVPSVPVFAPENVLTPLTKGRGKCTFGGRNVWIHHVRLEGRNAEFGVHLYSYDPETKVSEVQSPTSTATPKPLERISQPT